jgi:UDP-N-acetyl-D-glucosamine dehydrogenase
LDDFILKTNGRTLRLAVIGLGYVGLPLMLRFNQVGFPVIGIDLDAAKIALLAQGRSPIRHISACAVRNLAASTDAQFTSDYAAIQEVDVAILCVPTPLTRQRQPDMAHVCACAEALMPQIRPGQLIVLESTVYPGATEEIFLTRLNARGMRPGEDIHLAYSPERSDPGNTAFSTQNTPKLCAGFTRGCLEMAVWMYSQITEEVVSMSSIRAAEMTKLLENIHRCVNIGLVNEMKVVADRMDIDIHEVIAAAATKPFGFTAYEPGPGLGGHCIPVDPLYLTWKAREYGLHTRFIELAAEVNAAMPEYVVGKVVLALNGIGRPVRGSRILVCGLAYKKNIDDLRESPAIVIVARLLGMGGTIAYSDAYVSDRNAESVVPGVKNLPCDAQHLAMQDCVVIATDHDYFDYGLIRDTASLIVDTRGRYPRGIANLVSA